MIKYVEYLETDGSCYMEIPPRNDYDETSVVEITASDPNYNSHYWFSASNWGTGFLMGRHYEALRNNWLGNNVGTYYIFTNNVNNSNTEFAKKHTYTLSNKGVSLDGVLNQSWTPTSYSTSEVRSQNLRLFGYNDKQYGQTMALSGLKIYDFKIYNKNALAYHLRPCLDDNNTPCMYDEISKTYYYNKGTGTFSYGNLLDSIHLFANNNQGVAEDLGNYRLYNMKIEGDSEGVENGVDYVDCLIGDGASWINTEIVASTGYQIDITFMSTSNKYESINGHYCAIYGSSTAVGYSYDVSPYGISVGLYSSYVHQKNGGTVGTHGNISLCYNKKYTMSSIANNVSNPNPLYLFALNFNGNKYDIARDTVRIYDFKIYDTTGVLKMHLRPCLDTKGVPCMYDEVSQTYFYNQGTGEFKYKKLLRDYKPVLDANNIPCLVDEVNKKYYYDKNGNLFGSRDNVEYRKIDYLEGDGNSYFDIGNFTLTDNSKVEITVANRSWGSVRESLFTTSTNRLFTVFEFGTNGARITHDFGYSFTDTSSFEFKLDTKYTFTMSSSEVTKDGTVLATSEGSINETANVYIFRYWNRNPNVHANATSKLYGFKLYDGDEIVFDGIPVLDKDNTPCLYDKISKQFFYNAGSGEFGYGIEELECPPCNQVDYLQPLGNDSYIETLDINGLVTEDTVIEIKTDKPIKSKAYDWFGTTSTYNMNAIYMRHSWNNSYSFSFCGQSTSFSNNDYEVLNDDVITFQMSKDGVYANGEFLSEFQNKSFATGWVNPFALFSWKFETTNSFNKSYENMKIYYLKMTTNGETILNFLPCLDDNGVPCVYESVNGNYYYNVGTTGFTYGESKGYKPILYIESNGTQYIDTGVVPTDNTDIDMVCRAVEGNVFALDYWYENSSTHYYTPMFSCSELNNVLINNSEHSIVVDYYNSEGTWKWQSSLASGSTTDLSSHSYISVRFVGSNTINYINDYVFILGNALSSRPQNSTSNLQDCMYIGSMMNNLSLQKSYKYNNVDTTVSPNLTTSQGATLTMGSKNLGYLTEEEIEQATTDGWTLT